MACVPCCRELRTSDRRRPERGSTRGEDGVTLVGSWRREVEEKNAEACYGVMSSDE